MRPLDVSVDHLPACCLNCLPFFLLHALISYCCCLAVDSKGCRFVITGFGFFPMVRDRRQVRYECSLCGRTFSNVYNLKVHMRDQHAGLGMAKCDICSLSFKNLSTLRVHKSNYHRKPTMIPDHNKETIELDRLSSVNQTSQNESHYNQTLDEHGLHA